MLETFVISTFLTLHPPKQPPKVSEYHGVDVHRVEPLPETHRSPIKLEVAKIEEIPRPAPKPAVRPVEKPTGSCMEWIQAAGITEVQSAQILINRESGCNPYARNPSSGACGVAQELPCGKSGCELGDGACQVKWMHGYVISRYGSWAAAVAHHDRNNWY